MSSDRTNEIRLLVNQLLRERGSPAARFDDESLFLSGKLDSSTAINLIMALETDFGVDFSRIDFDLSTIDSIATIASLVRQSRAA
jgi:acyl carrier protein